MPFERELQEALAAAAAASSHILSAYETFVPIPDAPVSISTDADRESQEIILRHLRATFPADGLVAEEATPTLAGAPTGSDRVWVVDPIDGTRGFAMKNGEFSVMVGLTVGGRPVVGVVAEPVRNRVTYATAGGGCWAVEGNGAPVRCVVSSHADIAGLTLVQSHSKPGRPKVGVTALNPGRVVETYSAGVKLAIVARGEADVYVNDYTNFHDWDVCAGHILVEEAGGTVSTFDGSPVVYGGTGAPRQRGGLLASNGHVHAAVVARLAKR